MAHSSWLIHLRVVPGFWIAVEELRRPELRIRPVIIGGLPHQRGTVREANILAQRSGVHPDMALSQAYQQCPDGVFLLPDPSRYEAVWEAVCNILRTYTPLVESIEMGQAVCDLSGCERQWGDGRSAAYAITRQIQVTIGITPWLGVASNRLVAQLASTIVGADGISVIERGKERAFLADLPITLLPDVDPQLALTFRVLGLRTIGQFAALPARSVKQRFGVVGERLHCYARGIDPRPVVPPPAKPLVVARYECEDGSPEEAATAINRLAHTCAAELQHRYLAGRLVELTLTWENPSPSLPQGEKGDSPIQVGGYESPPLPLRERDEGFSVPYRIHSMLPQPNYTPHPLRPIRRGDPPVVARCVPAAEDDATAAGVDLLVDPPVSAQLHPRVGAAGTGYPLGVASAWVSGPYGEPRNGERTGDSQRVPGLCPARGGGIAPPQDSSQLITHNAQLVRTPIDTAPPLIEQAQRLLLQSWPAVNPDAPAMSLTPQLHAIELQISEFEPPSQLSFAEFNRLDQTGMLAGMSTGRLQALLRQEQILTARYGEAPFCHVAQVDPDNVLAERRFRWQPGLRDRRAATVGRSRRHVGSLTPTKVGGCIHVNCTRSNYWKCCAPSSSI